jgi:hypothetical protein
MVAVVLTPAALAAGSGRIAAGHRAALPGSTIKGKPAHWSPTSLNAKAKWTGGSCTAAQASFTMHNAESVSEKVTLTGTHLKSSSGTIPAGKTFGVCITKGYTGTAHVTLKDKKKLTVHFA